MKSTKFKITIIGLLFLFANALFGQSKGDAAIQKIDDEESYISTSLNYISDAVFMGRRDSVTAPYLYPSITYHHKSGFYGTGSFSFLTKADVRRIDLFLVTAGYDFTVNNFSGDFSVTKYFFNEDSYNVISEVEGDVTSNISYDFDNVVNLTIAASIYFNNNSSSDFFLSSELSHDFVISNQKIQISPTIGILFGSQNFYEEYYTNNRLGNARRDQGKENNPQTTTTNVSIQDSEKFNLMAVEFSLPMWYSNKSFTISFLPTLALPQSEATIVADEKVIKEKLDETFYWMLGIGYNFGKK